MAIVSPKNIAVKIYSISGNLIETFYSNTEKGAGLFVEATMLRNGGLDTFSFTVSAKDTSLLYNNMICKIEVDGQVWFGGYAYFIPTPDNDKELLKIIGKGFYHRLKEKKINVSYIDETLYNIIDDLGTNYLGPDIDVKYTSSKIIVPNITGVSVEFKDKSLHYAFTLLNKIANNNYDSDKYRWGVGDDQYLFYGQTSNDIYAHLFEGYQYLNPKVETVSDGIVNKFLVYRTIKGLPKETEYIDTYEDTTSQSMYGLFEKKVTFPDYIDEGTVDKIIQGELQLLSKTRTRLTISNVDIVKSFDNFRVPFKMYRLSNRRKEYETIVSEMESLDDWDTSHFVDTVASIDHTIVMTSKSSIKIVTSAGSKDEYMELEVDPIIRFPSLFSMYIYFTDINGDISVRIIDTHNNSKDLDFKGSDIQGEWINISAFIDLFLDSGTMNINTSDKLLVTESGSNEGELEVDTLVREGVLDIYKVQVIINNDNASTIYLDTMHAKSNSWRVHDLLLYKVKYTLSSSYLAELTLGMNEDNLIAEIKESSKDGKDSLDIVSKQGTGRVGDWGAKEGPSSYSSTYRNIYHVGMGKGNSLDWSTHADSIEILEDGVYWVKGVQRASSTTSVYVGVALDGSRSGLENKTDGMWNHDHADSANTYTQSNYIGPLSKGDKITCGPSSSGDGLYYASSGYAGTLSIIRIG